MTKTLCLVVASGGSDKRRFYVVLHLRWVRSTLDAVKAAIVAEQRAKRESAMNEMNILKAVLLGVAAALALVVLSPRRASQQEWIFVLSLVGAVGVLVAVAAALPN